MSGRPTRTELVDQLAAVLWAIREHRKGDDLEERRDDVADIVADTSALLEEWGLDTVDAEELLEPLECVCLMVAELFGWAEETDELLDEIRQHLDEPHD